MISRSQVKYINSLKIGKFRNISRTFIAEGPKLFDEILNSDLEIKSIFALGSWLQDNEKVLGQLESYEVNEQEFKKISTLSTPNQVLFIVKIPEFDFDQDDLNNNLVLALHDIRDPGNLGTIIRTADWFGINQVICSKECVDIYHPKVIQATMGSIARIKIQRINLTDLLGQYAQGVSVYGASAEGKNIYQERLPANGIIIIGNESHGIAAHLNKYINKHLSIPSGGSVTESLNAGIATAIIISEFRRQNARVKQK